MLDLRAAKVLVLAALAMLLVLTTNFSTAAFTSSSTSTATVSAAADWTPPTVGLGLVAPLVKGDVSVQATGSDLDSGLASVRVERRAGTGAWTTICAQDTSPASCTWNTTGEADGDHELRASATDRAGNVAATSATKVTVDNTPPRVAVLVPTGTLSGVRSFGATTSDAASGVTSVVIQYAVAGSTAWSTVCPAAEGVPGSWSCTYDTAILKNGAYDFRAIAADKAGNQTISTAVTGRQVQNPGPSVSMESPGAVLTGSVELKATASSTVGVTSVEFQYAPTGTSTWKNVGSDDSAPYAHPWDTMALPDGRYDVRAIATDTAGNRTTSAVVSGRLVDNTGPSVVLENPGAVLTGKVKLNATAHSLAGVTSVQFEYAPTGTTAWTTLSTDPTAPYSFEWDTSTLGNGTYDLRAVMLDAAGRTVEAVRTRHRVSNVMPLLGSDIQTTNKAGGTAGLIEEHDSLTFTFATVIDPTSVLAGWDGRSKEVTLRVREGQSLGLKTTDDTLDVLVNGQLVSLGTVNLQENFVKKLFSETATMEHDVVTVGGSSRSVVTITVGWLHPGSNGTLETAMGTSTMIWTDPTGELVYESGLPPDKDF